jgi:hypothetical protein
MTHGATNPLIDCNFIEHDATHSTYHTTPKESESTSSFFHFFEEQVDLISEVISFLDVKSLLSVCQTTKIFSSCLRHDHVITSVLSTRSSLPLTSESLPMPLEVLPSILTLTKKKKQLHLNEDQNYEQHYYYNHLGKQTHEVTIMKRLLQVFEQYNTIKSSQNGDLFSMTMANIEQPSPMRLLRLVNGKKCERCNRKLSPSSTGCNIVLPSLTFGKFCCTQCIFT